MIVTDVGLDSLAVMTLAVVDLVDHLAHQELHP
jgi:hypothetical protein